jgi:DNA-binding HxlR family transcriptional regulator
VDIPEAHANKELMLRLGSSYNRVYQLVEKMLHPDLLMRWKVLDSLFDGAKQWKELKQSTGYNPGVLSRVLKLMVEDGWVERTVERTFPTRVSYCLTEKVKPAALYLKEIKRVINVTLINFVLSKGSNDASLIRRVQRNIYMILNMNMSEDLRSFLRNNCKETQDMVFFSTIVLNLYYWCFFVCLTQSEERARMAHDIFGKDFERYKKEIKAMTKEST